MASEPARDEAPPFEPYIPPESALREMTPRTIILGTILGVIFGASSLYLVLKVGLTVSASIPVAVISITFFRLFSKIGIRDATILENNIVQTAGSAGESIAFGVGVTMPAIMILGFDLEISRVMLVAVLGGLLGILMMIPLRRALIVQQHGILKYPEGTACAEVLKAGASEESKAAASESAKAEAARGFGGTMSAKTIFAGFGIGLAYKTAMVALKGWKDVPEKIFGAPFKAGSVSAEISPELVGVGYIIGPRIASVMCAGGVLAYLVLIPIIKFFGDAIAGPLAPGTIPISEMGPNQIRGAYVLYIGAGAVAAGGIVSLGRSIPTIWRGLREGLRDIRAGSAAVGTVKRTDRDLSMRFVLIGVFGLVIAIMFFPALHMNLLGALMVIVFGFLFVTVSSRLTGEIGSSSNPISGMTVATLLLTCLIFLVVGWTGGAYYVTALSVGAIVCIAASNGGTTSQDLKTGFLVGATPRNQQISILIGALVSALFLGPILLRLNDAATVYVPVAQVVPAGLQTDVSKLTAEETLAGSQGTADPGTYKVWQKTDDAGGPQGKYLVDNDGRAKYLVDPGINGTYTKRPDGSEVRKFDAPKATLMSYIIKGILDRQLPWGLVLFGVMIALVLEMSGIPSLAFAVGVYLPLSSSTPIWIGGLIRWIVDKRRAKQLAAQGIKLNEEQLAAESDKSPGVLMASGYIAGGAIAGIVIAFLAGVLEPIDAALTKWSAANNPFYTGANADLLSMIPFLLICALLYLVGREALLGEQKMIAQSLLVLALFVSETPALDVFETSSAAGRFPVRDSQTALLTNGEASFAARIRVLEAAKKSVRVQALIFSGDESGLYVSDLLKKKKAAGLDVRVIVDATSNLAWETQWMYFDLKQHGIEVEGYEAMYLSFLGEEVTKKDPLRVNKRYHDKMWVIDAETPEAVAIVGGLNIANEYFRVDPTPLRRWRDQDMIMRGPIVEDVARCFDDNYEYLKGIKGKLPSVVNPDNSWKLTRSVLSKIEKIKVPTWMKPELVERVKTAAAAAELPSKLQSAKLRFIQSRPRHGETFIEDAYLSMIARAKKTIHIANAYFIPSKAFRKALTEAAGRGVKITIITNSPTTNDIAQIAVVSRALYASLLSVDGIEIHEWIGPPLNEGTLHAKLAVFDGVEAIVGSYNLDPRSAKLNSETVVAIRSAEIAGELEKYFLEQDLTKAKKVTLEEAKKYARPKKLEEIFSLLFSMSMKEWL